MSEYVTLNELIPGTYPEEMSEFVWEIIREAETNLAELIASDDSQEDGLRFDDGVWSKMHYAVCDTLLMDGDMLWERAAEYDQGVLPIDIVGKAERKRAGKLTSFYNKTYNALIKDGLTQEDAEASAVMELQGAVAERSFRLAHLSQLETSRAVLVVADSPFLQICSQLTREITEEALLNPDSPAQPDAE